MLLHLLVKYFLILKEKFTISTWPCIILYFLPLRLFLSILFLLFLLLILFFLPFHPPLVFSFTFPAPYMSTLSFTSLLLNFSFPSFSLFSCSLSSLSYLSTLLVFSPLPFLLPLPPSSPLLPFPFPPFPFNFSFPIFVLFFLPPDPFLPTPYTPLVLFSTFPAPYTSTPPLITSPFNFSFPSFPLFPSLLVLIFLPLHPPPSFFLIYLSCPPILPPLLSLIVLSELFKCLTSVMILCNHAVWV